MSEGINPPAVIIALMIGELKYQPTLNAITSAIVAEAVAIARKHPAAIIVCESEPMRINAEDHGLSSSRFVTAISKPSGHTTRQVAEWVRDNRENLPPGPNCIVTHEMHADRARRIMERCGVAVDVVRVSAEFTPDDLDWKLRSKAWFGFYSRVAELYCRIRRWT